MTAGLVLLGAIALLVGVYLTLQQKRQSKYLAMAEYWVYLPGTTMPPQDDVMTLMVRDNPYSRRGVSPIGPKEGLVFSDVRLHIALVLRSKNPHIFRPDLFAEQGKPRQEHIDTLKASKSMVKLRYVSDIPLKEKTHLQFLLHAADAVAQLGEGTTIYDVKAEQLMSRDELRTVLKENFDVTGSALHTAILWKRSPNGGVVETRGLSKIGVTDLRTAEMEADQRVIATNVMAEAVQCVWASGELPEAVEVTTFDDTFKVQFEKIKDAATRVRILRVQAT